MRTRTDSGRSSSRWYSWPPQWSHTRDLGWPRFDMKHRFAVRASAPPAQARHDLFQRQVIAQHRVELELLACQELIERLGLGDRTGETVQQKAALATEAADPLGDQRQHRVIRDQVAAAHR